uniref:Uncharacterized protein n=1 Tax=Panagrolaimus superbus TaxID=310955 RepID=A0A914XSM2_9BILA
MVKNGVNYLIFTPKKKNIEATQEETPKNDQIVELDATITNPSFILFAFPTEQIHSSQLYRFKQHLESCLKLGSTNSLVGRHGGKMNYMVENPMETLEHRNRIIIIKEMQKFFPFKNKAYNLDLREIPILNFSGSIMFKIVKEIIPTSEETLKKLGVEFDENGFSNELPQKANDYLMGNILSTFKSFSFKLANNSSSSSSLCC